MPYTWTDNLYPFLRDLIEQEGAKPNVSTLRLLANQGLRIISRRTGLYEQAWSNATPGGALTLVGASCLLPEDCYRVDRVEWGNSDTELPYRSTRWLDTYQPGWREDHGEPSYHTRTGRYLLLSSIPVASPSGKLIVRGAGALPDFSDDPLEENPLQWFQSDYQLLPAYYVLAELPADPQNPKQALRSQKYAAYWQAGLAELTAAVAARATERFEY